MGTRKSVINYSLGATFSGAFSLIGMLLFGVFFILFIFLTLSDTLVDGELIDFLAYPFVIFIMFMSLALAANMKGTLIDVENRSFKKYKNFILFKIGKWQPLGGFSVLVLTKYLI